MRYLRFIFGLTKLCFILSSPASGDVYSWTMNFTCGSGAYFKFSNVKNTYSGDIDYRFSNGSSINLKHKPKSYNAVTGLWVLGQMEGTLDYASGTSARVWMQYDTSGTSLDGWGSIGFSDDCELSGTRIATVASSRSSSQSTSTTAVEDRTVCYMALDQKMGTWDHSGNSRSYVRTAKSRGYRPQDCGRILGVTTTIASDSNNNSTSIGTETGDRTVCYMALDQKMGTWDHSGNSRSYVRTAKSRGFSVRDCAVLLALKPSNSVATTDSVVNKGNSSNLKIGASLDDPSLCQKSTIFSKKEVLRWGGKFNPYVGTAKFRGLSIETCRDILQLKQPYTTSLDVKNIHVVKLEKAHSVTTDERLTRLMGDLPKFESTLSTSQLCASSVTYNGKGINWDNGTNVYLDYAKSIGLTLKRCKQALNSQDKQIIPQMKKLTNTHAYEAGKLSQFSEHCAFYGYTDQLFQLFKHNESLISRFNDGSEDNDQDNVAGGYDYEQNLDCQKVEIEVTDLLRKITLIKSAPPIRKIQSKNLIPRIQKLKQEVVLLVQERERKINDARLAEIERKRQEELARKLREQTERRERIHRAEIERQNKLKKAQMEKERKEREELARLAEIERKRQEELARKLREQEEAAERARLAQIELQRKKEQARIEAEKERLAKIARAQAAERKLKLNTIKNENRDSIAVIIGNKNYKGDTPNVNFAKNDADAMKKFVLNKLFYRPGNLIDLRDATQAQLREVFGTESSYKGKIYDYVREKESNVIIFYSGHGVPGMRDRRGYLLPVDANPNRAELTGYPVDTLLKNLAKIQSKSMTVFIDACFSGNTPRGMLVNSMSGLTVEIQAPRKKSSKIVVLTASKGDQVASWDKKSRHGLFTKHLLDALYGAADKQKRIGNKDGKVTLGEVKSYLDREMTYQARRRFSRDQVADVIGDLKTVLFTY